MILGFLGNRYAIAAVVLVALAGGVFAYGRMQYRAGVKDTAAKYLENDRKGARNVESTTREILEGIGADPDTERLLRDTGGLRD